MLKFTARLLNLRPAKLLRPQSLRYSSSPSSPPPPAAALSNTSTIEPLERDTIPEHFNKNSRFYGVMISAISIFGGLLWRVKDSEEKLKSDIAGFNTNIVAVATRMKTTVEQIKSEVSAFETRQRSHMGEVAHEIQGLKTDIVGLEARVKSMVISLKGDINGIEDRLKGDLQSGETRLKGDIGVIKGDMVGCEERLRGDLSAIEGRLLKEISTLKDLLLPGVIETKMNKERIDEIKVNVAQNNHQIIQNHSQDHGGPGKEINHSEYHMSPRNSF